MTAPPAKLRLGTRSSRLAVAQATLVAEAITRAHAGVTVELVTMQTTGDIVLDRPLHELGGKGVFSKEIELALLDRRIDLAVHSLKDLPVTMPLVDPGNLIIAAIPPRADPADVLVSHTARSLEQLRAGARIGTSSLRRRAQVLERRPDALVVPLRGNVDTRLRKLEQGEFDAIVLAAAGLQRLGAWNDATMTRLDPAQFVPAAGQGALAVQCRADDAATRALLAPLDCPTTRACVEIERQLVAGLHGDCHSPIGVLATQLSGEGDSIGQSEISNQQITGQFQYTAETQLPARFRLTAAVAARGGSPPVVRVTVDAAQSPTALARLRELGADALLRG